jgi:hypothetical protein
MEDLETPPTEERASEPQNIEITTTMRELIVFKFCKWITFSLLLWVALYPILITSIVADDLILPFNQFLMAGPRFEDIFRLGVSGASAGHFNYVGQVFGVFIGWLWIQLPGQFGLRFSLVYALTKFFVFFAVIIASSTLLRELVRNAGGTMSHWQSRIYVGLLFAGTLQIHLVWSNDPVASYPMSGYASVALAMWSFIAALRTFQKPSYLRYLGTSVLILISILYYEMNVAVLPAILVYGLLNIDYQNKKLKGQLKFRFVQVVLVLALPAAATIFLQLRSAPQAAYSGVSVDIHGPVIGPFLRSAASSLPASSWHLAYQWMTSNFPFYSSAILSLTVLGTAGSIWWRLDSKARKDSPSMQFLPTSLAVLATASFWFGATTIQALTGKVQTEATQIGHVYNFYASGSTSVVIILVLIGKFMSGRTFPRKALIALMPAIIVFGAYQYNLNTAIQKRHYSFTPQNRNLLVAFTEDHSLVDRCKALDEWQAIGWPDYYRTSMSAGIERAYFYFKGELFCRP